MKKTINEKGITLVALVITVVVLLILAGVAISTMNETGIISKSNDAAAKFNASQVNESKNLIGYEDLLNKYSGADKIKFYIDGVEYYKKIEDNDLTWSNARNTIYRASDNKQGIVSAGAWDDRYYPTNAGALISVTYALLIENGEKLIRDQNGDLVEMYETIISNHNYVSEDITWHYMS